MTENELKHFGIKGMKWGIRRFQNEDGSLTPAGRERYGEDRYTNYGDGRYEIQKGAKLQRVLADEYSRTDMHGITYASFTKRDNNRYPLLIGKPGESKVLKLSAKTTLKSPSSKEAASVFFKILKDDPKAMKEFTDAIAVGDEKVFKQDVDDIINGKLYKKSVNGEDLFERYFMANHLLVYEDKGVYTRERFFNELSKRGYNMVRDDFDWYSSGGTADAIILFDGSATVQIDTQQVLSKAMMKKVNKYWEVYGEKGEEYARKYGIS